MKYFKNFLHQPPTTFFDNQKKKKKKKKKIDSLNQEL
jgi:hypothetical protein